MAGFIDDGIENRLRRNTRAVDKQGIFSGLQRRRLAVSIARIPCLDGLKKAREGSTFTPGQQLRAAALRAR